MRDVFHSYKRDLEELLERLGKDHPRYTEALTLQTRLLENIAQARRYGDTEIRRAERAQIMDGLNQLALEIVGVSFNELCESQEPEVPPRHKRTAHDRVTLGELLERAEEGDPEAIARLQSLQAQLVKAFQSLQAQWTGELQTALGKMLEPIRQQLAQITREFAISLNWEMPSLDMPMPSGLPPHADLPPMRELPLKEIVKRLDDIEQRLSASADVERELEDSEGSAKPILVDLPPCPFVAGPKITDSRLFVGRKEELRRLVTAMEGVQPISVNVIGERRIGKSSLLYHFFQTWEQRIRAPERYVIAYLSLQDAAAQTETDFYHAIAQALLARPVVQHHAGLVEALNQSSLDRKGFGNVMKRFQTHNLLPVLCLDEFEALLKYPQQFNDGFYDALRALMDDNVLMLVVASLEPLDVYRRQQHLTSYFFNLGHMLQLGELGEEEAADLVCLPASTVSGAPAALSLEEQRLARKWGGRHPCLLQLAASFLCQARQEGRDVAWARERFEVEAHRVPRPESRLRWLRQSLRWLVWDLPMRVGCLARGIGGAVDEVTNWAIGIVILIVIILALLGVLTQTQVVDLLRRALGR